jgi:hypothetical protein
MNVTRLLGTLTLATGGGLLLSGPLLGQDLLRELAGESVAPLRLTCVVAVVLGGAAVALGIRDERETYGGKPPDHNGGRRR